MLAQRWQTTKSVATQLKYVALREWSFQTYHQNLPLCLSQTVVRYLGKMNKTGSKGSHGTDGRLDEAT